MRPWATYKISFSGNWPLVDKRIIILKFAECLPEFGRLIILASFQDGGEKEKERETKT
jgi:hypothetical protein